MGNAKKKTKYDRKMTHRRKRRGGVIVWILFAVMCLSVFFALSLTVLFKIKSISIKGLTPYTNAEIIKASGMEIGENMFISIFTGAEKDIETTLPYIKTADINRHLDGTVEINVKIATAKTNYALKDGYILVDADGKILEKVAEPKEGLVTISGVEPKDRAPGVMINFANQNILSKINETQSFAEKLGVNITAVEINEDISVMNLTIEDRIIAELGDGENIEYKLTHLRESMDQLSPTESGVYSFSSDNNRKAYFEKKDIHADPEQNVISDDENTASGDKEDNNSSENTENDTE